MYMDINRAIQEFNRVHTELEIADMYNDIQEIERILNEENVNIGKVELEIDIINHRHPDNRIIYKLLFSPHQELRKLYEGSKEDKINDLTWKRLYLKWKISAKTLDEIRKELYLN